ncbi:1-(5-phosphoribosyl)-5-[(5-phosphoribosylamino)methylideneamino]imidazole-4-carboxamide isomerase [uncultured Anaerofustis sp.]|uniref:1-(5-phosphoribosyl)-5-[(5- phosphoribosylamino)methylideneamino]imidazole-4- carboxamide isomerase n=1 Tax=uncultured Anaerofustis sp. TaxID=904996 RepID=UPI0025F9B6CF|nr:1-(5-phosphoribosyl)-5-[(5-phosphoribosylamino)methylideneamino]imidazole-4-carboxamide isomerase [uncultured Anaerofustis sp.]
MIIFPAIDIRDNKCVRLSQGNYDKETVYFDDPFSVAQDFQNRGVKNLHIVDLDAALIGELTNFDIIKKIITDTDMLVEVGGGIRGEEQIKKYVDIGVDRVSIGTKAVKDFEFLKEMSGKYPYKISLSLDVKDEYVYIKGWSENSGILIWDYLDKIKDLPLTSIVVTDIKKDGMLSGPSFELYRKLKKATKHNIVVSGGVSSLNDINKLKEDDTYGVIVGKALYENKFSVEDIIC